MEDDLNRSKDDLEPRLRLVDQFPTPTPPEPDNPNKKLQRQRHQDLPSTVKVKVPDHSPPPPRSGVDMKMKPSRAVCKDSPVFDISVTAGPHSRTLINTGAIPNSKEDNITYAPLRRMSITVNRVDIMSLQQAKKTVVNKNTAIKRKNNKNTPNTAGVTTPSSEKITNYFVRKRARPSEVTDNTGIQEDRNAHNKENTEDNNTTQQDTVLAEDRIQRDEEMKLRKKTLMDNPPPARMKDRINKFEMITSGAGCEIAGGRCRQHHCMAVRDVVQKKMSTVDKFGKVVWKIGEGTILVFPKAHQTSKHSYNSMTSQTELGGVSNKKKRIFLMNEDNQSRDRNQIEKDNSDS